MRAALVLLLLASGATAGLASDVKRAFRRPDPREKVALLRAAVPLVPGEEVKERNRAAREVEKALKKEPSPDVRKAAYDLLLELRTARAFDRLAAGVLDPDEGVRDHVRKIVAGHADPLLHNAIVRGMRDDASWRYRAAMVDLLLAAARENAKRALVEALEDEHPGVRARAAEALERLTGRPLGTSPEKWRALFAKERPPPASTTDETVTTADDFRKVEVYEGPIRGVVPRLYTVPIRAKRVVFVVDMSSSMAKGVRSDHFKELKSALFGLPSDVRFNILCFDQRLFFFAKAKSLRAADVAAKDDAARWLDSLPAGEKTDVTRSVVTGIAMLEEALEKSAEEKAELFILTDGKETKTTLTPRLIESRVRLLPPERFKIHVIALGARGTIPLKSLAVTSGGRYVEAGR